MVDITPLIKKDAQVIQSYKNGQFRISQKIYKTPVLVFPEFTAQWPVTDIANLQKDDFKSVIEHAHQIEVLLVGCGQKGQFVKPKIKQFLKEHKITMDMMDTGAACRTYNVLMAEGRHVAAALMLFN